VFIITPRKEEIPYFNALDQGLVTKMALKTVSGLETKVTNSTPYRYMKIFIQKQKENLKMFWSFFIDLGHNESYPTTIYSFSRGRGPLYFEANCKILTKNEVVSSNAFSITSQTWLNDELYKPADVTLQELVVIKKPDPKARIRKIGIRGDTK
jgi:hypothetical protein